MRSRFLLALVPMTSRRGRAASKALGDGENSAETQLWMNPDLARVAADARQQGLARGLGNRHHDAAAAQRQPVPGEPENPALS